MPTIIRFVLLTALRDRLFVVLILLLFIAIGISSGLAKTSMIEQHEMTLSFSSAVARLLLAIGLIIFVCFHIRHAFDSKEIDVMLSRPISRARLMIGYWLGFSVVSAALVAVNVAVMYLLQPVSMSGFAAWGGSLLLEMWIIVAIALFTSVTMRSAVSSVMASLVFYVAGRMMGFFLATIHAKFVFQIAWLNTLTKYIIEGVSIITPRLDLYGKGSWLIYGPETVDWQLFILQSASFIPLLLAVTIVDFNRRQF
ncbi:MAG: hypothetical protein K2Q12_00045 [Rickettsiales bacterium]|nr:hypothetical protein [Rickettsiales bacterium]